MRTVTRRPYIFAPWLRDPGKPCRMSHDHRVMTFNRPGQKKPRNGHGTIDYKRRLWQHSSATKGIAGMTSWDGGHSFAYGLNDEWALIDQHADYIEFQDRTTNPWTMYRIWVPLARRTGFATSTKTGMRWIVPLEHYTVVRRRRVGT